MGSIYLRTASNFFNVGTPVKICFEGKLTRGTLVESNDEHVCVRTPDHKTQWSHQTYVHLDRPEPPPRRQRRWSF